MNTRLPILIALGLLLLLPPRWAWAEARQGQDLLTGNGTAGPYTLSWKNVSPGTESVRLNDVPQTWGTDYSFDPVAGTITFTHSLTPQSAVLVRYGYDTAQATSQGGGVNLPLTLALNQHLSLNAQYINAATDNSKPGAVGLGLAGGWQGTHGDQLTTHLLFAPAMTGADATTAPNGLARLGLAAAGQTQLGSVAKIGFGLSRAGAGIGALGSDQWQAGAQKLTLNGTITPVHLIQATFGYTQTDAVTPGATGAAPSQTQTDTALTVTPNSALRLQTTLAQTTGGGVSPTQNVGVNAALTAGKMVALTAGMTQLTQSAGDSRTQSIGLALTPHPAFQINTGLTRRRDVLSDVQTASVDAKAQLWKYLQVSGGYQWRSLLSDSPTTADPFDSSHATVTLMPLAAFHLVGTYTQNPADALGNPQHLAQHGLGLETKMGALSLSGGYDWSSQYAAGTVSPTDDTCLHLGVGLRFSADTQLTGDYKQYLPGTLDPSAADAYSLGLTHNLSDRFNLSMSGTMQQPVGSGTATPNTVTAAASLGMKF